MRTIPRTLMGVLLTLVVAVAAACSSSEGGGEASNNDDRMFAEFMTDPGWEELIKAGQADGELVVTLGSSTMEAERAVYEQFGKDFGIKVTITATGGNDAVDRILAERSQSRYTVDISGQGPTGTTRLIEAKAFEPMEPLFVLPEVKNRSENWRVDYVPWSSEDPEKKYVTYYALDVSTNAFRLWYNTDLVSADQVAAMKSWKDILKPEWKGKIVIGDVSSGEAGSDRTNGWMLLGEPYFNELLTNQEVGVISYGAARDFADSLARGQYAFGMFPGGGEQALLDGKELGLPVDEWPNTFSEGTVAAPTRNLAVLTNAPHANAAKLFVNWYLSKAGQATYNALNERPGVVALRNDVPQGNVPDPTWARAEDPQLQIVDLNTDEYREADGVSFEWWKATTQKLGVHP